MTKEELIFELKKRCSFWLNNKTISKKNALECLLGILENEESHPSLPSDLDEAAEEYGRKEYSHAIHFWDEGLSKNKPEVMKEDFVNAFIAGAEWMARQGYTKEETVYFERLCDENRIMVDLGWGEPERGGFNPGDKVIVQIRKK